MVQREQAKTCKLQAQDVTLWRDSKRSSGGSEKQTDLWQLRAAVRAWEARCAKDRLSCSEQQMNAAEVRCREAEERGASQGLVIAALEHCV